MEGEGSTRMASFAESSPLLSRQPGNEMTNEKCQMISGK
jgi:hypothetical protein